MTLEQDNINIIISSLDDDIMFNFNINKSLSIELIQKEFEKNIEKNIYIDNYKSLIKKLNILDETIFLKIFNYKNKIIYCNILNIKCKYWTKTRFVSLNTLILDDDFSEKISLNYNIEFIKINNCSIFTKIFYDYITYEHKIFYDYISYTYEIKYDGIINEYYIIHFLILLSVFNLNYASETLKDNDDLIKLAIKKDHNAIFIASYRLQNNIANCLEVLDIDPFIYNSLTDEMQCNEEIINFTLNKNILLIYDMINSEILPNNIKSNIIIKFQPKINYKFMLKQSYNIIDKVTIKSDNYYDNFNLYNFYDNKNIIYHNLQNSDNLSILNKMSDRLKNNKIFILKIIKLNGKCLKYILPKFQNDKDIIFESLNNSELSNLEYVLDKYKSDKEIVLYAINKNIKNIESINTDLLIHDKEILYLAIKYNKKYLQYLKYNNNMYDIEFLIKILEIYPEYFEFIDDDLQDNKKIVLTVLPFLPLNIFFKFISLRLREDKEVVLKALSLINNDLLYENLLDVNNIFTLLSHKLQDDDEIVLQVLNIIENNYKLLNYQDYKIFLEILTIINNIFQLISERLWNNKEIILKHLIINTNIYELILIQIEFKINRKILDNDMVLNLLLSQDNNLKLISQNIKDNEVLLKYLLININIFEFISKSKYINAKTILEASKFFNNNLKIISNNLLDDKEIILKLLSINNSIFKPTIGNFKLTQDIIILLLKNNYDIFNMISSKYKDDEEIILKMLSINILEFNVDPNIFIYNYNIFKEISERLKNDKTFIIKILSFNNYYFEFISSYLKEDKEIVILALANNNDIFKLI